MKTRHKPASSSVSTRVDTTPKPFVPPSSLDPTSPASVERAEKRRAVSAEVYAKARAAWIAEGTREAVIAATGLPLEAALRLIDGGVPTLGLPSLRDAARATAAMVAKKSKSGERELAGGLAEEAAKQLEARAKAARAARKHEEAVLGDAVASRADEVKLVRANRLSALTMASVNASLLRFSSKLAASLVDDEVRVLSLHPSEKIKVLKTVADVVVKTAQASQVAVNMERLLMGEPTAIVARAENGPSVADMTLDEAEQWLALANRAFARRARRNTVIDAAPTLELSAGDDEDITEDLV